MLLKLFFALFASFFVQADRLPSENCRVILISSEILTQDGDLVITRDRRVFWKGAEVLLRNRGVHFDILAQLAENKNTYLPLVELAGKFWPTDGPGAIQTVNNNLKVAIFHIRSAFRDVDSDFNQIQTKQGIGIGWISQEASRFTKVFDHLEVHPGLRLVRWKGQAVDLKGVQFDFFYQIIQGRNEGASYTALNDILNREKLESGQVETRSKRQRNLLHAIISSVRKAFRDVDTDFDQIKNEPGFGYYWQREE